MKTDYNGWTNYATWRINLEIFDELDLSEFGIDDAESAKCVDPYELVEALKERVEYYIECTSQEGIARDYANAFVSEVNWHEIANHMINNFIEEANA